MSDVPLVIRPPSAEETEAVFEVHRLAFGEDDEADLVAQLLEDPTAQPVISASAFKDEVMVGHVLLTNAVLEGIEHLTPRIMILAPLAVTPDAQGEGVGQAILGPALMLASGRQVELVFVLGHPEYYSKFNFLPATPLGFEAPYPIPEEHADAWMVLEIGEGALGRLSGTVRPAEVLDRPEYWRE
jgi:putative acetyltransferase